MEHENGSLCPVCMSSLPRTEQAEKRQNVTEMFVLGQPSDMVKAARVEHVDQAAAFLFYEKDHPLQKVIHKMKYADQPMIGYYLGRQAAVEFEQEAFFEDIDVIIPVPLHPRRFRERGYNQSEYIARGISEVTGIGIDTTHVTRVRNTPKQAKINANGDNHETHVAALRKANVADAFAVNHPEQMYHKHILLVDDLITTGETVRSCLKAMRAFRGATFRVFALCKTR